MALCWVSRILCCPASKRKGEIIVKKWVYLFEEGNASMRDLLGGKGANLAEMVNLNLPVPPGFTITTEACLTFLHNNNTFPEGMWTQTLNGIKQLGQKMGREFSDTKDPLLVSVRSGSRFSMPGMMDTILNLGLNDESVNALASKADERFAWDAYRRLIQMFGKVVMDVDGLLFEEIIEKIMEAEGVKSDPEISPAGWKQVVEEFKALIERESGQKFPQDPFEQLESSVKAVFKSWNNKRAIDYRNATGISHDYGTAVNILTMVFGNVGWDSGSGVAFTRSPSTGKKDFYGEYLFNAQGEDVVSGARTPSEVHHLKDEMPAIWEQLLEIAKKLENHYREMQDIEFTIENSKLWMLQTRTGKRTAAAAVKIAVDMVNEGLITKEEAVARIETDHIDHLLHPHLDEKARQNAGLLAKGLNASPGAAVGNVYFDANTAEKMAKEYGQDVILVRPDTTPDDLHGMIAAKGILTQHGGRTSHAAVVARQLGKPCVAGCEAIKIDLKKRQFTVNGRIIKEGDTISLSGRRGEVYDRAIPTVAPSFDKMVELKVILEWADRISRLKVWTNADHPDQAIKARNYGAQGIGLCRTEHMFMGARTEKFQKAILSEQEDEFRHILYDVLLPLQHEDFYGIFKAMDGLPVIVRLLDPPLHEFLPSKEELLVEVTRMEAANETGPDYDEKTKLLNIVGSMKEYNPMMGLRGCRMGILRPELNKMQVKAIFEAACDAAKEGVRVHPEVMIPITSHVNELKQIQPLLKEVAEAVMAEKGIRIDYKFGTMIEIPRAAVTADQLAKVAQFFSFGTNDLTQMTFGISRDDAERKFLLDYVEMGILPKNPFRVLDVDGVGQLIAIAVEKGRQTRPGINMGVCGEHGGNPESIEFFHRIGLDYVSCSPYRVPIARLSAAHAAIKARENAPALHDD
ncbi:MAG: pyruvate, phosphate dikinase [Desulfobacterales bacterium]|nr:pyruvate, phosphate dikinase [Desulfobacterales bacterium]